jgi:hypothetical protein
MASVKMQRYIVALLIKPSTPDELTRDSVEISALEDEEAVQKAKEWAKGRAMDGDILQVVKDGRAVKSIPLKVVT